MKWKYSKIYDPISHRICRKYIGIFFWNLRSHLGQKTRAKILENILKYTILFGIKNCSKNIGKYSSIYDPISLLLPPDWCSSTGPSYTKLYSLTPSPVHQWLWCKTVHQWLWCKTVHQWSWCKTVHQENCSKAARANQCITLHSTKLAMVQ